MSMVKSYDYHRPVMLDEVLSFVKEDQKMTYVDLTLGRGGHASAILNKLAKGSTFYGVDRDQKALDYCKSYLDSYAKCINIHFIHSVYSKAIGLLRSENVMGADFILMDIGVSSPQFDDPERGFSYRFDAPLDMRMDQNDKLTAYEIVNNYDEKELYRVFQELGEVKNARPVIKAILKRREEKKIETTFELVEIIKSVLPPAVLNKKGHPAKQYFLGLRYEVNKEIDELKKGLSDALSFLNRGGRLVIITFNSEEDRIVKNLFKSITSNRHTDKYNLSEDIDPYQILTKKPLLPKQEEIDENNRAKASILRAIERR